MASERLLLFFSNLPAGKLGNIFDWSLLAGHVVAVVQSAPKAGGKRVRNGALSDGAGDRSVVRGEQLVSTSNLRRLQRGEAILQSFLGRFPGIFAQEAWHEYKPLKIGIHLDIIAAGVVSGTEARLALRAYVNRRQYQAALAAGGTRYDLDGRPSGEVRTDAQEFARKSIARHKDRLSLRAIAKHKAATGMVTKTSAKPEQVQLGATPPSVRRLGLADLKAAARRRKAAIEGTA